MTFKIERLVGGENEIVLRVCGGMQIECVNTLKELIKKAPDHRKEMEAQHPHRAVAGAVSV
jgi:hypothetical protein